MEPWDRVTIGKDLLGEAGRAQVEWYAVDVSRMATRTGPGGL